MASRKRDHAREEAGRKTDARVTLRFTREQHMRLIVVCSMLGLDYSAAVLRLADDFLRKAHGVR